MDTYEKALQQIEMLIAHLRANQSTACALADEEDRLLIRLADWKAGLQPEHRHAMMEIGRIYDRYFPDTRGV